MFLEYIKLLPKGIYWRGRNLFKLIKSISLEFERIRIAKDNLIKNSFPDTCDSSFYPIWEKPLRLNSKEKNDTQRVNDITAILKAKGSPSFDSFLEMARKFDPDVKIIDCFYNTGLIIGSNKIVNKKTAEGKQINAILFSFAIKKNAYVCYFLQNACPAHLHFGFLFSDFDIIWEVPITMYYGKGLNKYVMKGETEGILYRSRYIHKSEADYKNIYKPSILDDHDHFIDPLNPKYSLSQPQPPVQQQPQIQPQAEPQPEIKTPKKSIFITRPKDTKSN